MPTPSGPNTLGAQKNFGPARRPFLYRQLSHLSRSLLERWMSVTLVLDKVTSGYIRNTNLDASWFQVPADQGAMALKMLRLVTQQE